MGRFKTNNERFAKKMKGKERATLCAKGHHQESAKKPGYCVHCGVKQAAK